MTKITKMWLARDEAVLPNDFRVREEDTYRFGKLHLFYDTPLLEHEEETHKQVWCCARKCCEIPSYMFPNIKEKSLRTVFFIDEDFPESFLSKVKAFIELLRASKK